MDFRLEIEFSKADILKEVDGLKKQIDDLRPLPDDIEGRVMQKLRLDWNYNSNAIEGNKLNYGETTALLMHGITAKGKPLKDHLDIQGHNDAINFLLAIIKEDRPFTEIDIRQLHEIILVKPSTVKARTDDGKSTTKRIKLGVYKTSRNYVETITGETHYYVSPEETPAKMQELMEWYNEISYIKGIHPVVIAALYHHKFVEIHPFDDGNGRLARILMNLILMKNGYPPVVIKKENRENYYSLLSRADANDSWPFVEYIIERLNNSLQIYLRAAKGGDIDDDEDLDKEIALFKMNLQSKMASNQKVSPKAIYNVCIEDILPLLNDLVRKVSELEDLFYKKNNRYKIEYTNLVEDLKDSYTVPAGINGATAIASFFSLDTYKINTIFLYLELIKLKSEENSFDVTDVLTVSFNDRNYSMMDDSLELSITKQYDDRLTKQEKRDIQTIVIRNLKRSIEKNFKN
ncbi:MAG: Fic family protein [Bacteroidetes bacterium]|jgi:Fic family protein|nr:Fic family protein [Bacteroidota bacterium]